MDLKKAQTYPFEGFPLPPFFLKDLSHCVYTENDAVKMSLLVSLMRETWPVCSDKICRLTKVCLSFQILVNAY